MTFVQGRIKPNTTNLKRLADGFRKAPSIMKTVHTRNTRRFISRVLAQLKVTPPPRRGNVPWQTPKQQRAFFASNGFGGGVPHRRTGAMIKGWKNSAKVNIFEWMYKQLAKPFVFKFIASMAGLVGANGVMASANVEADSGILTGDQVSTTSWMQIGKSLWDGMSNGFKAFGDLVTNDRLIPR